MPARLVYVRMGGLSGAVSALVICVILQLSFVCPSRGEDTCFMTLVLPKEKVKHSCDVQEAVVKRLDALEGQIAYQKTVIADLENMIMKERGTTGQPVGKDVGTERKPSGSKKILKTPPTDDYQVDPGIQSIPDDDYFIPDLSDDYPDFADYSLPEVPGRSGGEKQARKKARGSRANGRGMNLLAIDLLRPYIQLQMSKLRANLTQIIADKLHPFAAGFEEVKKFMLRNQSQDSNALSSGAQTSMNTIALSHVFLQVSNVHNKLLHYNTRHITLQKKVSLLEGRITALTQGSSQKSTDLRERILQLEHENSLLKMNQTCASQLSEMKLDISRQISEAKDNIRLNCKSRKRPPRTRARASQGDYYYDDDDEGFQDDNAIYENFQSTTDLEKNLTIFQNLVAQQMQHLQAVNKKHAISLNDTKAVLDKEMVQREQGDVHINSSTQLGLGKVRMELDGVNELVHQVSETASQIQADMKDNQQVLTKQLAALKRLVTDLHEDTAQNFSRHGGFIDNLSRSLSKNVATLQRSDRDLSLAMKTGLGRSDQRIAETSESIKQNNNSLVHLSDELRELSEQVHVSVLSLNESVRNLGVQLRLNNETWLPYNFSHSMSHVKCYGEKYVKRTNYESGRIVGVVLCTKDMYKIFLSESLTDTFLNIADSSGFGRDHCEFVGGRLDRTALLGNTPVFYKRQHGYTRSGWGEQPKLTTLWVRNPSPEWYRCGVSIPS